MKQYYYRAKKSSKEVQEGVLEAASEEEVIAKVNDMGFVVVDIREKKDSKPILDQPASAGTDTSVRKRDGGRAGHPVTRFYKQLARMLQSGIPLLQALTLTDDQVEHPALKKIISEMKAHISEGNSFSQTLLLYPDYFSTFDVALMEAGEMVGHLDVALKRVAAHREAQEKIAARVRGALAYPAFVLVAGIAAVIFMLCFVLPKFSDFFLSLGQELPWMTRVLIRSSQIAEQSWMFIVGGVAVLGWMFTQSIQNNERQIGWHRFYLSIPKIGKLIKYSQFSRFSRTMSLLLESGIPLLKALQTTLPVVTNQSLRRDLQKCVNGLKEGGTFSESLSNLKGIPVFVTQLVRAGESSGRLQESLNDIADWYEQELQEYVEVVTKLLEPLLILGVGAFLGLIVIAVLLPIFSMNAAIS